MLQDACKIIHGYKLLMARKLNTLDPNRSCIHTFSRSFKRFKILVVFTWLPTTPTPTLGEITLLFALCYVVNVAIIVIPSFKTTLSISSLLIMAPMHKVHYHYVFWSMLVVHVAIFNFQKFIQKSTCQITFLLFNNVHW
jgi:hypothetical protein